MPTFDNTPPGTATPAAAAAYTSTPPDRLASRLAFSAGGALQAEVFASVSGNAEYQFTTPFDGRLTYVNDVFGSLHADIGATTNLIPSAWATNVYSGYEPGIIPAGVTVKIRCTAQLGLVGSLVGPFVDFQEDTTPAAFPNTPPTPKTIPGVALDNSAPDVIAIAGTMAPASDLVPGTVVISQAAFDAMQSSNILGWAVSSAYQSSGAITRDSNGVITSMALVWPDGATGTYTGTANANGLGTDAYTVTHVLNGVTKTVTQSAVTRDGSGNITSSPVLTIA